MEICVIYYCRHKSCNYIQFSMSLTINYHQLWSILTYLPLRTRNLFIEVSWLSIPTLASIPIPGTESSYRWACRNSWQPGVQCMASCLPWSRLMADRLELYYCGKGPWVARTTPITIFWLFWLSIFNGIWSLDLQPRAPKNLLLFVVGGWCCRVCTLPRWNTCFQLSSVASCHASIR